MKFAYAAEKGSPRRKYGDGTPTLTNKVGGTLNPTWCEWLMGFPTEWSALEPLEMPKFRQWLRSHGLGVTLSGRSDDELINAVSAISRPSIEALQRKVRAAPRSLFGADQPECAALVEALAA